MTFQFDATQEELKSIPDEAGESVQRLDEELAHREDAGGVPSVLQEPFRADSIRKGDAGTIGHLQVAWQPHVMEARLKRGGPALNLDVPRLTRRALLSRRGDDMVQGLVMSPRKKAHLIAAVEEGAQLAGEGLEGMIGRPITAVTRAVTLVPLREVIGLVGEPSMPVVGVYFSLHDAMSGHLIMLLADDDAGRLVDLLFDQPAGTAATMGALEESALQEIANVMGSYLLSGLADAARVTILPSPPAIARDMCGALLDGPLAMLAMKGDEVLFIETEFHQAERRIRVLLLVLPDQPSLEKMLGRLG